MQKRYIPIAVVVAVLVAVSAVGYLRPDVTQAVPPRTLHENSGGRVIFTHMSHADDYGYACEDCHHDGPEAERARPLPCGTCHPKEFDDDFRVNHQTAFPSEEYCERCHDVDPTPDMAEDERPDKDMLLLRGDAFHAQCMDCHADMGVGPYGKESCYECHAK